MFSPTETQLASTGAMLRGMREAVGLSLEELAERAGPDPRTGRTPSKGTLSRFERGQRTISADLLARIARAIADETHAKRRAAA